MEKNKLAQILEESLKADGALPQNQECIPPAVPRGKSFKRAFNFKQPTDDENPDTQEILIPIQPFSDNIKEIKPPSLVETPKFSSALNSEENKKNPSTIKAELQTNSKPNSFFSSQNTNKAKGFQNAKENAPNILNDDEFEIDGMGEVWEYAGHSANVNLKEESESSSDEFDPNCVVKIQPKVKNITEMLPKSDNKPESIVIKQEVVPKKKKIDLKTRGMQAEARIQQKQMKDLKQENEKKDEKNNEEIKVDNKIQEENEWDNISVKEIEDVKHEKTISLEDPIYYNRNITADQIIETIESYQIQNDQPPQKKSFFRGLFSCFRIKPKSLAFISIQRQKIIKFSKEDLNFNQNFHVSMVKKIYFMLKNIDNCPLTGDHWKEIGFQDSSISPDLKKVGMFGLFSIFYFLEKYPVSGSEIFQCSVNLRSKFRFALVFLSFSEMSLNDLEENILRKQIENSQRVYEIVLDYCCGLFLCWFKYCKENDMFSKDIPKSQEFIKEYSRKHLNEIFNVAKNRI